MISSIQRNLLIIIALIVVFLLACLPFFPVVSQRIAQAKIGDQIGTSGIVLTTGGFVITIWQLLRTKQASLAAQLAVSLLQMKVILYEDVTLCETCLAAAKEIERANTLAMQSPSKDNYMFLAERYQELRISLVRLRERRGTSLNEEERIAFTVAVTKLQDAQRSVPRRLAQVRFVHQPNLQPLQSSIQDLTNALVVMSMKLNASILEELNDQ